MGQFYIAKSHLYCMHTVCKVPPALYAYYAVCILVRECKVYCNRVEGFNGCLGTIIIAKLHCILHCCGHLDTYNYNQVISANFRTKKKRCIVRVERLQC